MSVKSVHESALIVVGMRWCDRLLGLISMVILARLLVPADFGIIVMASLVVGLIDVLLDIGVSTALIHNQKADDDDYNTAWTLRLIQSCLTAVIIFVSAPLVAVFFDNPLVVDVLRVMALSVLIAGFENIGVVTFQKNMEFGKDFKFFFYKRFIGFVVTLALAAVWHNYWAMVIGALSLRLSGVILSYRMHPHRPRFSLSRTTEIWSFSKWVLLRNIISYLDAQADKFLVGHRADEKVLGTYSVAQDVSAMPTTELLMPLGRVLFPAFAQKRDDRVAFARSLSTAIGIMSLVAMPACVGLVLTAQDAVLILLGANWIAAAPLIQIMAISNLIFSLTYSISYALLATGKVRILAFIAGLQMICFLTLALIFFPQSEVAEIAAIRVFAVCVGAVFTITIVITLTDNFSIKDYFLPIFRPLTATACMAAILIQLHAGLTEFTPVVRILIEVAVGCITYAAGIGLLWLLQGRPEGAEAYLIKNFAHKFIKSGIPTKQ